MSKIYAITSTGKTEKSFLDLRFGKCENVVFCKPSAGTWEVIENPFKEGEKSGINLLHYLKEKGVSVIITGEVGPGVSQLLEREKVQLVLLHEEKIRIEEIMERLKRK